jgi:hypothetical protein
MQINSYVSDRHKKRKRRRVYLFAVLGVVALYLIFFVTQWFVLSSPVFRVDHVVVVGNGAVPSSNIVALVQASALPSHVLFPAVFGFRSMLLWPNHVSQKELTLIPQLAGVIISKDYFSHTVTITATERTPSGIWCFSALPSPISQLDTSCYWFDNTGTIFERSFDTQGNAIFVVNDAAQAAHGLNQKVLPDVFLPNFISIINVLHKSGLAVNTIALNDLSLQEVDVATQNGPTIYFSLRFPADDYLPVIQKLMLQPGFGKLHYIDCRTQNRLYYK